MNFPTERSLECKLQGQLTLYTENSSKTTRQKQLVEFKAKKFKPSFINSVQLLQCTNEVIHPKSVSWSF